MSERIATRSALLELIDERYTMAEGHAFLDEKCLLLAGEMLRELKRYEALWSAHDRLAQAAEAALRDALGRHGLEGLAVYPLAGAEVDSFQLRLSQRSVMGVPLIDASAEISPPAVAAPWLRTPEAAACAQAHADLLANAVQLAAAGGNLERLMRDYQTSSRRARALDGVLLPETGEEIAQMTTTLEEQEREDALCMRAHAPR